MDKRLIENIEDYRKNALTLVSEMQPVTFCKKGTKVSQLGIVSQDLQVLEPLSVTNGQTLNVSYESLTILLLKAIKELKAEVEALKAKKESNLKKSKAVV